MWILSKYTYDYYEWEEPILVSNKRLTLVDYVKENHKRTPFAEDEKQHEKLGNREKSHYYIHWISEV